MGQSQNPRPELINDARLFARAVSPGGLLAGWARVRSNQGAAGGDRVTIQAFERSLEARLESLSRALISGEYRPGPIRKVDIPKPSGGVRTLSIPCVVDRVAQSSVHNLLSPLLETEFEDDSYAYRPGRGVTDAVRRISALRDQGYHWVLDADVEKFFDRVPHDGLMERLGQSLSPGPLTELIGLWLSAAAPTGLGLPQGSPLSPLLANLYLDRVDEALSGRGVRIVRYADDFVVLAKSKAGARAALDTATRTLAELELVLHPDKTRVLDFDQGLPFLGHLFVRSMVMKTAREDIGGTDADTLMAVLARQDQQGLDTEIQQQSREQTRREAGLEAAFRTLHMRTPDRRVDLRNTAFSVQTAEGSGSARSWREILAVPHQEVDRIDLWPGAEITDRAREHALATDTLIAHVNGRGQAIGWTAPRLAVRAERRLAQAQLILDPDRRLDLARRIVGGRIRNQRGLLRRLNKERGLADVATAARKLSAALKGLETAATLSEALGYEGHASAIYWPALVMCAPGQTFHSGRTRPATDPFNLVLNFTAWLLERDVATALSRVELDPGLGILHQTRDRGDALVYDLMEEFRAALAESVTVYVFNNRVLNDADFEWNETTGLRLGRRGGDALIRAYEMWAERVVIHPISRRRGAWRGHMVEQAFSLVATFERERPYEPMVLNY